MQCRILPEFWQMKVYRNLLPRTGSHPEASQGLSWALQIGHEP